MINKYGENNKNSYMAYGLNISSDICFPELMPASGIGDVNIICDKVPTEILKPIVKNKTYQISTNQLLFYVEGVGHYYVENGNRIVVQPDEHADTGKVRLFVLGTAFGALLLQRGILPIHGSAVVIDGLCIIFTGVSGAGKSTLSSAFRKKGYPFLADDISVITLDEGRLPWVQPAYPQQKLCRDSVQMMGDDISFLKQVDEDTDKYAVPVLKHFQHLPVRLAAICELRPYDCCSIGISQVFGTEKLQVLMKNIYRVELLRWFGQKQEFFKQCLDVAKDTAFFRMIKPKHAFTLEDQVSLIKEKLEVLAYKEV